VQRNTDDFRARCEQLVTDHPMVGDLRGDGYFWSLELVKDKETKETFSPAERDELIKGFLTPRARELGVYMRFDDRAETAAQFSPPLVAGPAEFEEMVDVLRQVLDEAWDRISTTVEV
jgi:adenosylmethionine-8-amino-7-oxononanoate aminotransferase